MEISGSLYVRCEDIVEAKKAMKMFNSKNMKIEVHTKYMCNYTSFEVSDISQILGRRLEHCNLRDRDSKGDRIYRTTKITKNCIDRICITFNFL